MFKKKVRIETTKLPDGHLVWITGGKPVDLGPTTLEDFKILAYVTQEAYVRLPAKKNTTRLNTLARVASYAKRIYDRAKLTQS